MLADSIRRIPLERPMHPIIERHHQTLTELCVRHRVRRLELFGSAAGASAANVGDFDFLVEFLPATPSEHSRSYFGLLFGLEDALKLPIDLVEEAAVKNPHFLRAIELDRCVLYAA